MLFFLKEGIPFYQYFFFPLINLAFYYLNNYVQIR